MIYMNRICKCLCAALACLLLAGCALAEDTSPLPQLVPVTFPESSAQLTMPERAKDNYAPKAEAFGENDLSYHDDSLDIQLHHIRVYDTPTVVAFVQIANPAQLKTEQAKPYPNKATMRSILIAKRVNAVFAVNADWFTYHGAGIIYRNGELLRNRPNVEYDGLAIDVNGDFHIIRPMTEEGYAQITTPIAQSFAFGPALVIDGEVQEIVGREVTYKQRVAIGQIAPLSYVIAVTDGPDQKNSIGLSVPQMAQLMHDLGAHTAYNLDGGQSSSMVMRGVKVNGQNPKMMRAIGDIIYFVSAIPNE